MLTRSDKSFGILVLTRKLLDRAALAAEEKAYVARRAAGEEVSFAEHLVERGRLEATTRAELEAARARHGRACGACERTTFLLPGETETSVRCEHCGGELRRAKKPGAPPRPARPLPADLQRLLRETPRPALESAVSRVVAELSRGGRTDDALACADHALALDPGAPGLWFTRAWVLDEQRRHEEALVAYDEVLRLGCPPAKEAGVWFNRGHGLARLGRVDEALASYDRAIARDPADASARVEKGRLLDESGRPAEAIACYDEVLARPDQAAHVLAVVWGNKGNSLGKLGRAEEALPCYDRALALEPEAWAAWHGKANRLVELGRYEEALSCATRVTELAPEFPDGWSNRGLCLAWTDRAREALPHVERAVALAPGSDMFRHNLDEVRRRLGKTPDLAETRRGAGRITLVARHRPRQEQLANVLLEVVSEGGGAGVPLRDGARIDHFFSVITLRARGPRELLLCEPDLLSRDPSSASVRR